MRHGGRHYLSSMLAGMLAAASLGAAKPLAPAEITIPSDAGYVLGTRLPAEVSSSTPIIIHIQEAHTNEEAQRRIIDILEDLIRRHGLRLILVEGGAGNVSLSYMRTLGPAENRHEVAEKYLKLGLISGEEYLDIVSDHPLTLWGVEQPELYEQHVQAFLDLEALRERLAPALADLRRAVEALSARLLDPAFTDFTAQAQAFESGALALADFTASAERLATQHHIELAGFPQVSRFLQIVELEQRLKRKADSPEQRAEYARYQALSHDLHPAELAADLGRLTGQLRRVLARTPEAARFDVIRQQLELVDKLVAIKLSPDDYRRVEPLTPADLHSWTEVLHDAQAAPAVEQVAEALPQLKRFYELAQQRDTVLVDNALAKLKQDNAQMAVMITGGFHGAQLAERLSQQGVGVVSVVPKVSQPTNEQLYRAVLKYKSGHAALAEVERATHAQHAQGELQ